MLLFIFHSLCYNHLQYEMEACFISMHIYIYIYIYIYIPDIGQHFIARYHLISKSGSFIVKGYSYIYIYMMLFIASGYMCTLTRVATPLVRFMLSFPSHSSEIMYDLFT